MPTYRRRKSKGPFRGPHAKTLVKARRLYAFISEFIREHGFAPSIREMCVGAEISSTSTVHYYLNVLREVGLVEGETQGRSRAVRLAGTVIVPPAGLMGRSGEQYTREELEAALEQTAKILVGMYDGFARQKHWLYRTRHPVELPNLAAEVAVRFTYDHEKHPLPQHE